MKNSLKRVLAVIFCVALIALSVPFTGEAAAVKAQLYEIDGVKTVFVANFGRISYNGTAYGAFKTIKEAQDLLGKSAGTIVISGDIDMTDFKDTEGRGPLNIIGIGTKYTGNNLVFPEGKDLELAGDLYLEFLSIKAAEDFSIITNGYNFEVSEDSGLFYYVSDYTTGTRTYNPPINMFVGNNGKEKTRSNILSSMFYDTIAVGGVKESAGNIRMIMNGETAKKIYAGIAGGKGAEKVKGNIYLDINEGIIDKVVAGSAVKSTIDGNVIVNVDCGAESTVTELIAGSETAEGKITGNVVISSTGKYLKISAPKRESIEGKLIIVAPREMAVKEDTKYDYYVVANNGMPVPVFDGKTLKGFRFTDENGCYSTDVKTSDGKALTADKGIFTLPGGKTTVTVTSDIVLSLNRGSTFVSGYEDGTFLPQKNLSRAEAITMLVRLITDENKIKGRAYSDFEDVADDAWYAPYIGFFEGLGYLDTIATDYGTTISPNALITRGEFCELTMNIVGLMDQKKFSQAKFKDVDEHTKYYVSIGQAGYLGLVTGYEDGSFGSERNITRAEVVTIINRLLSRTATDKTGGKVFSDTKGHWAEAQIRMAANPAVCDGNEIWTTGTDITKGDFTLLEGKDITVADQISALYERAQKGASEITKIDAIDQISKWQIDNIVYSESDYSTITGTKYYISPNGSDDNDGLSPETAWQSLRMTQSTALKDGDGVLFERGAVFRGRFTAKDNITYSAYGKGEKPRFYGSLKNYADASLWKQEEKYPNVWKLSDRISEDVGVIIFDSSYEIGDYNELYGIKVVRSGFSKPDVLHNDLEFLSSGGKVYLYSVENPGTRFESIEIGSNGSLVGISGNNIVIDNLHFRYHGGHVIGTGNRKNITSKNCIYAYTGGSILSGETRYGNAFESYGSCDGWYAYNNWMYQIYDTGVTHQYSGTTTACTMNDVEYSGNVIEMCHWCIEYYNNDSTDGSQRFVRNVNIHDNICRLAGYGWGSSWRMGGATMYQSAGITANTSNYVSYHNILDRSSATVISASSAGDKKGTFKENIYVQKSGGRVGYIKSGSAILDENGPAAFKGNVEEENPIFIQNDDTTLIDNIKKF